MNADETDVRATVERIVLDDIELLVIDVPLPTQDPAAFEALTQTERAVARLAIEGLANKQIAAQRGTSAKTVANQLRAIYRKLGVASRFELTAKFTR